MKIPFIKSSNKDQEVVMVDINKIQPNPYQPRSGFSDEDIIELAESIKNFGLIQPLTIRPRGDEYELIAGERRLRACKYLGHQEVPVIIREFSNQETGEIALVENIQRKDLDFIEESLAYSTLLEEFDLTQKELADKLGKSQSTIANKLRILGLPIEVRKKLKSPHISERHGRALLKLDDKTKQLEIVDKIREDRLTVRETENLIKKVLKDEEKSRKVVTVYKDLRVFTNTLNKTIKDMKKSGLDVKVNKKKEEDFIEFRIRLPRKNH